MARQASTSTSSGAAKTIGALVAIVVLALAVLLVLSARPRTEPFDPRSAEPDGARGLVLTLRSIGADVSDTGTVPDLDRVSDTRVLVLEDRLDQDQRDRLLDFVQAGGIAVVADPESALHGGSGVDGGAIVVEGYTLAPARRSVDTERNVAPGRCTIEALGDLRGLYVPDGVLFPVGPSEAQCFTDPSGATASGDASVANSFVIVRSFGEGVVVGLGDNEPFVNRNLRRADNAGLLSSLLVPSAASNVTILTGSGSRPAVEAVGSGDETLRDLVPTWAWMALALGAVAFVVFATSRSIRPGRIVEEPIATPIAGSELISATGNLMQRAGHAERAGWLLVERLHRELCVGFGVANSAPLGDLDRVVSAHASTSSGEVEQVLRTVVHDDAGLLALATQVAAIRRRALSSDHDEPGSSTDPHDSDLSEPARL